MKHMTTAILIAASTLVVTSCSARQELTREERVEKLRKEARTADNERRELQQEGLREGEREMARERTLQNGQP